MMKNCKTELLIDEKLEEKFQQFYEDEKLETILKK